MPCTLKNLNVGTNLVNLSDMKSAIGMKGVAGDMVGTVAMSLLGINRINRKYSKFCQYYGREFTEEVIKHFNVKVDLIAQQLQSIPKEGPFIVVSNHPFGAFDGIILFNEVSAIRPDFKILTNFILSHIKNLSDYFLPVNPFTDIASLKSSFSGVRAAKEHLASGGGLGLFPAGEVATYHGHKYSEDIEWARSMAKLIQNSGVPVIPVYFHGENSPMFHTLGKIHPLLRTAQLPREMLKRGGKTVSFRIGKPISPSEISEHSLTSLKKYLRNRTYALEAQVVESKDKSVLRQKEVPLEISKGKVALEAEIDKLTSLGCKLFDGANYSCFLAEYDQIPVLMHELGIRREEAFREVGEGTGLNLDIDEYDTYYKHLILWDNDKKCVAGGYRIGNGEEIMPQKGLKGFYTSTLFKYTKEFTDTLSDSIELGRSFVSVSHKKEALPLLLLLRGLMFSMVKYPNCKFLFGPVSTSAEMPLFYRSLMVYYILEEHSQDFLKENIKGNEEFKQDFMRVNPRDLIETKIRSIDSFDRFLLRLSDNQYRMPTLVKQYLKLGAKIACFNVDKAFNYSLDGLVFLKISDIPKDELLKIARGVENSDELLRRFNY